MSHQDVHIDYDATTTSIVIPVAADYADAIGGGELWQIADYLQTALVAMAWARMDDDHTAAAWGGTLPHIDRLTDRLTAIKSVVIRQHKTTGGSIGDLAMWLDTAKATAQYTQKKALEPGGLSNGRYLDWIERRHDAGLEPGSDGWKRVMGARLRRAINTNDPALLAEVTQVVSDQGMRPTDLITDAATEEITERQENELLHQAITTLVHIQLDPLDSDARKTYLAITNRKARAEAVVTLYAGKPTTLVGDHAWTSINDAYHLATHIIETETDDE